MTSAAHLTPARRDRVRRAMASRAFLRGCDHAEVERQARVTYEASLPYPGVAAITTAADRAAIVMARRRLRTPQRMEIVAGRYRRVDYSLADVREALMSLVTEAASDADG